MSYILDALKRADAERERGTVPGLRAQPVPGVTPESHGAHARLRAWPMIVAGIALAVAVIAAGAWVWRSLAGSDRTPVVVAAAPTVPALPAAPALPPQPAPVAEPTPVHPRRRRTTRYRRPHRSPRPCRPHPPQSNPSPGRNRPHRRRREAPAQKLRPSSHRRQHPPPARHCPSPRCSVNCPKKSVARFRP